VTTLLIALGIGLGASVLVSLLTSSHFRGRFTTVMLAGPFGALVAHGLGRLIGWGRVADAIAAGVGAAVVLIGLGVARLVLEPGHK